MITPGWTDERIDTAKKLWADGVSAGDIAAELGGITRSAVLGKLGRLGLLGRKRQARPRQTRVPAPRKTRQTLALQFNPVERHRARSAAATLRPAAAPAPIDDAAIPIEQRRTLLALTSACCRWPVGDPRQPGFFFCGAPVDRAPYCPAHTVRAGMGYGRPLDKLAAVVR